MDQYDFSKICTKINTAVKKNRPNLYKAPSDTPNHQPHKMFYKEANQYLQELNAFICESLALSSKMENDLFPTFDSDFCSKIICKDNTLLKYLPYIMTAFYWNSQSSAFRTLLESLDKRMKGNSLLDSIDGKSKHKIIDLFSLSSFQTQDKPALYRELKIVGKSNTPEHSASYRKALETILINCYYKDSKLLGLLNQTNMDGYMIGQLRFLLDNIRKNPNIDRQTYLSVVDIIFSEQYSPLCTYARINPLVNMRIQEIKQEIYSALNKSIAEKKSNQKIDSILYNRFSKSIVDPQVSFVDGTYSDAQKFYFKHIYLAIVYSLFVLACQKNATLKKKIRYEESYALFQEHTMSFCAHPTSFPFFSFNDLNTTFSTSPLSSGSAIVTELFSHINDEWFFYRGRPEYSFIVKNVETLKAVNQQWLNGYKNPQEPMDSHVDQARLSLCIALDMLISIGTDQELNKMCSQESIERQLEKLKFQLDRSEEWSECELDEFVIEPYVLPLYSDTRETEAEDYSEWLRNELAAYEQREQSEERDSQEVILELFQEDVQDEKFNMVNHLFSSVFQHRGKTYD